MCSSRTNRPVGDARTLEVEDGELEIAAAPILRLATDEMEKLTWDLDARIAQY